MDTKTSRTIPWQVMVMVGLFLVVMCITIGICILVWRTNARHKNTEPTVELNRNITSVMSYKSKKKTTSSTSSSKEAFTSNPTYETHTPVPNVVVFTPATYSLRDYYVFTSYNTCITGPYDNGVASIQSLRNALYIGARCLDFEIYSEESTNQPIVACSITKTDTGVYPIQCSQPLLFSDVMKYITTYAFVAYGCNNPTDPLILSLRIKTSDENIPTNLANIFSQYPKFMIDSKYNVTATANFGQVTIPQMMNRISVVVESITDKYLNNIPFMKYVNMCSPSDHFSMKQWSNMPASSKGVADEPTIIYNKQNITMVIPDHTVASPVNKPMDTYAKCGCQMIAIQLPSNNRESPTDSVMGFFNTNQSAFVLKPDALRYTDTPVAEPIPQKPEYSFASRTIVLPDSIPLNLKI
jgi:hypothetical protein